MDDGVSAPTCWLRRRAGAGEAGALRVNAQAAVMIAQRPDAVGDLYKGGLVWQVPDDDAYLGKTFVTLTPVWESEAAGPR